MITVKNLTMRFGTVTAVDNVSFSAAKNEILGLLGPNGAGKTTTMRVLTTYLDPVSGGAEIGGYDLVKNPLEIRKLIGYLPETVPLYYDFEAFEYIDFVARARGLEGARLKDRIDWVVNACKIKQVLHKPIEELSKGYKQRVTLAQALIHDPAVLILDEPTSGLDPLQILEIRSLIKQLSHDKTIIFSTHILQEVEAITDRVCIINEGRIISDGSISSFRRGAGRKRKFNLDLQVSADECRSFLNSLQFVEFNIVRSGGDTVRAVIDVNIDKVTDFNLSLNNKHWIINELSEILPTFEETFVGLIQQTRNGGQK
ncbi:MAG: ATP-binding cassette domain-containing protein [Planctomycetes bacterium]|nr:ATP-binding cassette domain-containing protein [Planctomycetota bacterium]